MSEDIRIRKVEVLQGRARAEADKKGLNPDDLVIVRTTIVENFPEYSVEKIEGDPVSFLLKRAFEKETEGSVNRSKP